jgi:hypothetical protein
MEVIPKINLPLAYNPKNKETRLLDKIGRKLKSLKKSGSEKILYFSGTIEVETMFYLYLFKKYKSNCFLHDKQSRAHILGISIKIRKIYSYEERKTIEDHLKTLAEIFVSCIKKLDTKIIIIPVQLSFPQGGHANLLIYRKNLNQIEHFEPHGQDYTGDKDIEGTNKIIRYWIKYFVQEINNKLIEIEKPEVKLIESNNICPYLNGLQALETWSDLTKVAGVEPGGYCSAWSMFFTELSLKNPEIPSSILMNYIFNNLQSMSNKEKANYLRGVVRGYSTYVNEKIEKYFSLFNDAGLTIKQMMEFSEEKRYEILNILNTLIELEMSLATDSSFLQRVLKQLDESIIHISTQTINPKMAEKLMLQIRKLMNRKDTYEKYERFNVISDPSQSSILDSRSSSPEENIELELVKVKEAKACPEGKEINPKTGRCVKIKTRKQRIRVARPKEKVEIKIMEPAAVVKACPEGKELNPKTGRCVKIKTRKVKKPKENAEIKIIEPVIKACPEGKELNPKTGRCVKVKTQKVKKSKKVEKEKACPEGKELNPKTGRCVKVKTKKEGRKN